MKTAIASMLSLKTSFNETCCQKHFLIVKTGFKTMDLVCHLMMSLTTQNGTEIHVAPPRFAGRDDPPPDTHTACEASYRVISDAAVFGSLHSSCVMSQKRLLSQGKMQKLEQSPAHKNQSEIEIKAVLK